MRGKKKPRGKHSVSSPSWFRFNPKNAVPKFYDTVLTYCQFQGMTPMAGGLTTCYQFRANSVFDPDFTGGGHQPYYRDQIVALGYAAYVVVGSSLEVKASMSSTFPISTMLIAIRANSDAVSDTGKDMTALEEQQYFTARKVMLNSPITLSKSVSIANILGVPEEDVLGGASFLAAVGANPAQGVYWNIVVQDSDHATTNSLVNLEIKIKYRVRFASPNAVAQS